MFKKATKQQLRLRMALMGAPGSGKSYSALKLAKSLAGENGKIAAIDTEHSSLSKYSDLVEFDVCDLDSFHPDNYTRAIKAAGDAGYDVLIIDSMSHAWSGKDGLLEEVDKIAKRKTSGNSFQSWKDATPILNRMIETILASPCHVIVTLRTKVEWVVEKNENGKNVPRKIGTAPIFKDQVEFEFDVVGEMNQDNELIISKSRCSQIAGGIFPKPGDELGQVLINWLSDGSQPTPTPQPQTQATTMSHPTSPEIQQRLFRLMQHTGHTQAQVYSIAAKNQINPDSMTEDEYLKIRDFCLADWAMKFNVFNAKKHAWNAFKSIINPSVEFYQDDDVVIGLWQAEIDQRVQDLPEAELETA